jgi:hypothetical protein
MTNSALVLIELNEVNFDVVQEYIDNGESLPNFERLMSYESRITTSEKQYDLLEPWIQWPSVHTGKNYSEHEIFRLGDVVSKKPTQIFELLESHGLRVGAISPMNAANVLSHPEYFVPDPWTDTPSDKSILSRMLSSALKQAVNDNSEGRVTLRSLFYLGCCFLFLVHPRSHWRLITKALSSRGKPWRKALFLDRLLHEIHMSLLVRRKPDFSTVFLNAGAHIQHHYFLNSASSLVKPGGNPAWYVAPDEDPLLEMLIEYDEILGDLLKDKFWDILLATGLTQSPVDETVFYYRLRDHAHFLKRVCSPRVKVLPRMTRDFLITCETESDAVLVANQLSKVVTADGVRVFGEIDNRGKDVFVVLDYSREITSDTVILVRGSWSKFIDEVVFVAVKNGQHEGRGFAYFSPSLQRFLPDNKAHVSTLFYAICGYFGLSSIYRQGASKSIQT